MSTLAFLKKQLDPAIANKEISLIVNSITSVIQPRALFVFGSAARMEMTDQSDIDILIVMATDESIRSARKSIAKIRPFSTFPVDLIWMTEDYYNNKKSVGGIAQIVSEEGRLLYGGLS